MKIVKSESLAEDVLQESFVKIWKKIEQYDTSKGRFFTWILNITRNTAIDHWRASQRHPSEDIQQAGMEAHVGGYEEDAGASMDAEHILDQLGEPERTLLSLSYFQGFSQSEIAKKMNMPLGTVKTKMRSSLHRLRTIFTS